MAQEPTVPSCCVTGFAWSGTPQGKTIAFPECSGGQAYVTGSNNKVAILLVHDLLGWKFPNNRLLADHLASEIPATVYMPDFFGGEELPQNLIQNLVDSLTFPAAEPVLQAYVGRNQRHIREPEIFESARRLRGEYEKLGAIGYCFGGWAVFRLGAADNIVEGKPLVDAISTGHPSWLTKEDIAGVGVPVQVLAPEHDPVYTPELKEYTLKEVPKKGVPFDYQHFPGVHHACFTRGNPGIEGERDAMERGKNAAVAWFRQTLQDGK
ncbi:hypothetical protein AAF712_001281 [Marasmius tenuissimus]|uniref:Dienelactone hydrolase domain-containing protein n=1 Tax=Marasmius tenuissimus TaxID=585030 RepID=A0ABR3AEN6_9AGAR